jgi:hypothetical protein
MLEARRDGGLHCIPEIVKCQPDAHRQMLFKQRRIGLRYRHHRLPEGTRQGMDAMSIRDTILSVFRTVAADQGRTLAPLSDELPLVKCGLDSLCFAIVVASLEDSLHVDPFNASEWVDFPVTLGDFVKLYDRSTA